MSPDRSIAALTGVSLVAFGFLVQWPTILTLAMFPILTVMYVKLAT